MPAERKMLKSMSVDTPLGPMKAIADDDMLYLLEFVDRPGVEREIAYLARSIQGQRLFQAVHYQ